MATVSTIERTVARNTSTLALPNGKTRANGRSGKKADLAGLEGSLRDLRGDFSRSAGDFSRRKSAVRPRLEQRAVEVQARVATLRAPSMPM